MSASLRRAFGLAGDEPSPLMEIRHVTAALVRPHEPIVVATSDILFSPAVVELFRRAEQYARAQGSDAVERRHLYAALREMASAYELEGLSFLAAAEDTVGEEEVIVGETSTTVEMEAGAERDPRTQR